MKNSAFVTRTLRIAAISAAASLAACNPAAGPTATAPAPAPAPAPVATPAPAAPPVAAAPAAPAETAASGPVNAFEANGFSPAWTVSVSGDKITFEVPDASAKALQVERLAYAKGVNYNGRNGPVDFTLDISSKPCTRTGDTREFTAVFSYGTSTYKGCADAVK